MSNRALSAFLIRLASAAKAALSDVAPRYAGQCGNLHFRQPTKRACGSIIGSLLFGFALLLGVVSTAQAAGALCSDYQNVGTPANPRYVVDGSQPGVYALVAANSTFGIDADCTIRNFPAPGGFPIKQINFNFPQHQDYVIVFDNVYYEGNMSCQDPTFSDFWMWWVNGSYNSISSQCQDFLLPVDAIRKDTPVGQTTATIGVPFTYTLTMPLMMMLTSTGYTYENPITDSNPLSDLHIYDDLTKTGADLTYVGNTAYLKSGGFTLPIGSLPNLGDSKHLHFTYPNIAPGVQLIIEVQVVLDNTSNNTTGKPFTNTATWTFDKIINGIFKDNLTGQNGISPTMTIAAPNLTVSKTGDGLLINQGQYGYFDIYAQNTGLSNAWGATIIDKLPNTVDAGMCEMTPDIQTIEVIGATTRALTAGQYTLSYTGESGTPACQLTLTLNDTGGAIKPGEQLHVRYRTKLDPGTLSGDLVNIAAASQWFNDKSTNSNRGSYICTPTPYTGTEGVSDCQDSHTVTVALTGYFYEKTVENLTSSTNPARVAAAGDTLRYTIRLQNVDQVFPALLTIRDTMGTQFQAGTLTNVTINGSPAATYPSTVVQPNGGANGTGYIEISNLSLPPPAPALPGDPPNPPTEIVVVFDITLATGLAQGLTVGNQADLLQGGILKIRSDDPNDADGRSDPAVAGDEFPTYVIIQSPQPPLKQIMPAKTQATIGEEVVYQITVPSAPYAEALYNVAVNDTLDPALEFVSATIDATGTTLNDTNPAPDQVSLLLGTINPNQQIVITLRTRVANRTGVGAASTDTYKAFTNSATYSYTRTIGGSTFTSASSAPIAAITIIEPQLTATKSVSNVTLGKTATTPAAAGDTLEYRVIIANSGASTAFDANIQDVLPANVSLVAGSATAQINGGPVVTLPAPNTVAPNTQIWGRDSGDTSLDIPAGGQLVLIYRVTVVSNNGMPIINTVSGDYTSLQDTPAGERTGVSCPAALAPNDYCFGPVPATINTADPTTIVKTVVSDTYAENPATAPPSVRVGDTVVYRHTLTLREGPTENVVVTDILPAGLAYDSLVSITPAAPGSPFTYSVISQPAAGATGSLIWNLGNISNIADNSVGNDTFVIEYRARVVTDPLALAHVATTVRTNNVALSYTGGDPTSSDPLVRARLNSSATIDVRQPVTVITKTGVVITTAGTPVSPVTGNGTSATPYVVDIINNKMSFTLQACNNGLAPAYGAVITDQLASELNQASITTPVVAIGATTLAAGTDYTYVAPAARGGQMSLTLKTPLDPGACVSIGYTVGFYDDIAPNQTWHNSADVASYWSLPPNSAREYTDTIESMVWMTNTFTPVPPTKTVVTPISGQVTIGETVTYEITVPSSPVNAALSSVVITDTLDPRLQYQGFTSVSGPVATDTTPVGSNNLSFSVPLIKAGERVVIRVTALVLNSAATQAESGGPIPNSVSYTYTGAASPVTTVSPASVSIVEPAVTMVKAVSNITTPGAAAAGGDTLEYTLTLTNGGGSIAHDVNVTDVLPPEVVLVAGSATAQIAGVPVIGFNPAPMTTGTNTRIWGHANGDDTLDIPANGGVLTLTFRVTVQEISSSSIVNNASADWTSLSGTSTLERTGAGCPATVVPNDYCTSATASIAPRDTNAIAKAVTNDTWSTGGSTNIDLISRAGDTITYQLTLTLREGLTRNVTIQDVLAPGLAFVDVVSVNGDTAAPYSSAAGVFTYAATSVPAAGQTGTLNWVLGNVTNAVDGNPANNNFVIVYRARVQHGAAEAPAPTPTTTSLGNTATLGYSYSDGSPATLDPTRMQSSASITVRQPAITAITKSGTVLTTAGAPVSPVSGNGTQATPYVINIVNHKMNFSVQACNSGQAPAYGVVITDQLAPELNQASITTPVVTIGATTLTAGTDYTYTAPAARGGQMSFTLNTPLNPAACVNIAYTIGFHTDIAPNLTWSNQAAVGQYWSLPPNGAREYIAITPVTPSQVWMTNTFVPEPPAKTVFAPASAEVTIGQEVTYEITVPGIPVNAALNNVVVTDTLDARLQYLSATQISGPAVTNNSTAPSNVNFTIAQIPAGQQVRIQVTALVLNSAATQAESGGAISNTVTYNYTGAASPLTSPAVTVAIVEPVIALTKSVPVSQPKVGDILTYTVTLAASGGTVGDIYSSAYDASVVDTLGLGLDYVEGSATLNGVAMADPSTNGADGINAQQVLTWAGLDIPEGTAPVITYEVQVLGNVGASQILRNDVRAEWTGIDGANANERNGTATPAHNDYFRTAFTTLTTMPPAVLSKQNPVDTNVAIGQTFTYTIRVPETPALTAIHDVRITDLLPAGVDFVSVAKVSTWGTWAPVGTVTGGNLVITDAAGQGIDIPVGAQAEVTVTVVLKNDIVVNYSGRTFTNTATYSFNRVNNDATTVTTTANVTTGAMTIVGPDTLTMDKSGPSGMRLGVPGTFTLTVENTGTGRAWDVTITDQLPNPTPGGMCSIPPTITSAQIVGSSGTRTLAFGTDYTTGFTSGTPTCTFTFTGQSAAAALGAGERLVITYTAELDQDNANGVPLTNIAGVTQWFSQDTGGAGATGETHTYTRTLTNGTVGTVDHEDAHTVLTESPTLSVVKRVYDAVTGLPAPTAKPGDRLRYVVTVANVSDVTLPNFSLVDDLGLHNGSNAVFVPGSLTNISVTGSTFSNVSNANGGTNNAGLVDIQGLVLGKQSDTNNTVTVSFEVTLAPVIPNSTLVLNQAQVVSYGYTIELSDDPDVTPGTDDPTRTVIASNPVMRVQKTAQDMTGDATVLMVGDTLRYTITVKNIGNENAINVTLRDALPANTTYVPGSTRLNGVTYPDSGTPPLAGGMVITAQEGGTPGSMRADVTATPSNVATITFDVMINLDTPDGTVISNQGFINGSGSGGTAFTETPSDDPGTPAPADPTLKTVIKPNGIVYNSISREPVAGVTLTLLNPSTGLPVPSSCFNDPAQQGQVTTTSGYYKFDLNFSDATQCPAGGNYLIRVAAVPTNLMAGPSVLIPPATTAAFDVPGCSGGPADAVPSTPHCEAQASSSVPTGAVTTYYLHLTLSNTVVPDDSQIFNNHIPVDPRFEETLTITKRTHLVNVTRGQLVPYTITVENTLRGTLTNMVIRDTFPAGFKYVEGSARYTIENSASVKNVAVEPLRNGRELRWENITLAPNEKHIIKLLLIVGSGVSEGEYINQAQTWSTLSIDNMSRIATASVRVVPDPTFDCTDIVGKVFDDANRNGYQDKGEKGLPGVRLVTARGLLVKTDEHGRYHITCAVVPDENRGSNFIIKVDDRSLPTGYRITTENPLVLRATRGKMMKFNFGATIHKVVRLDISNGVYEPGTTNMRIQWKPRMALLMGELKKGPSLLRIGYMAEVEDEDLVEERLKAMKQEIAQLWKQQNGGYDLEIETEVFWRTGAPPDRSMVK